MIFQQTLFVNNKMVFFSSDLLTDNDPIQLNHINCIKKNFGGVSVFLQIKILLI